MKISLSAGHGLCTPGKETPDGMKEWEFNAAVVREMMNILSHYQDVAIVRLDDPTGKTDPSLSVRTARSDAFGADIHIDVHANAFGATWNDANGIETFVFTTSDTASYKLACAIQDHLIFDTKLRNRGVKMANLHMVREPNAKVKVLVELGFMTNEKEAALLKSDTYRKLVAQSIVNGLVQVYELKKRVPDPPKKEVTNLYNPQSPSLLESTKNVLSKLVKDGRLNQSWVDKLEKGTLTESEAIGLVFVSIERGILLPKN